ncbi:MAG TPA: GNAT family N-acetyltransferase [Jiangellaceae bacterium]
MEIVISRADATSRVVQELCDAQQAEMAERYGEDDIPVAVNPDIAFVLATSGDGEPLGCGGVQLLEPGVGELKRMYVVPSHRGQGISRRLLRAVEALAVEQGLKIMRLETGTRQPESVGLYTTSGYDRIPRFGQYTDWPLSLCFEKHLVP